MLPLYNMCKTMKNNRFTNILILKKYFLKKKEGNIGIQIKNLKIVSYGIHSIRYYLLVMYVIVYIDYTYNLLSFSNKFMKNWLLLCLKKLLMTYTLFFFV